MVASVHAAPLSEPWVTVEYASVLGEYSRFRDEPVRAWSTSNQAVGEAGGWRALAKERSAEAEQPKAAERPSAVPDHSPQAPDAERRP